MKELSHRTVAWTLAALAFAFALLAPQLSRAQVVTTLPVYINNNAGQVYDFGNGPLELRVVGGAAQIFTSQGAGIGSGSTTSITLTATPAIPPCVGCAISGGTLVASSIVTAYNGTTGITTNTSQTVAASTPLAWGAACPTASAGYPVMNVQAAVGGDLPLFTLARICGSAVNSVGATVLPFAIGAH